MTTLLGILITTIIGLPLGGFLTYLFTKKQETKREIRNIKTKIYLEYIELETKWDNTIFIDEKDKINIESKFDENQRKIVLYGNNKVIKNLSILNGECNKHIKKLIHSFTVSQQRKPSDSENDDFYRDFYRWKGSRSLYINLIKSMRKDIGLKIKGLEDNDFYNALEYFDVIEFNENTGELK